MKALVLGGAASLHADEAAARELFAPDLVIAVNHAARDHPGPVDHWATFHPELLPRWLADRAAAGRDPAGKLWTAHHRPIPRGLEIERVTNWGGSSGLLAVVVGLHLECSHIVLAGVPLDYDQGHYDHPAPWRDAANYRKAWVSRKEAMIRVRSMSGFTAELLGAPTKEWLDATA